MTSKKWDTRFGPLMLGVSVVVTSDGHNSNAGSNPAITACDSDSPEDVYALATASAVRKQQRGCVSRSYRATGGLRSAAKAGASMRDEEQQGHTFKYECIL